MAFGRTGGGPADLLIVRDRAQAAALLQPQRAGLLEGLAEPGSAAGLARRLGLPRQLVNYHLRELERAGLVELVEERRRGNCVERVVVAAARRFLISPEVLGGLGAAAVRGGDCFSPACLAAAAARTVRDLAELEASSQGDRSVLATMSLETEVRLATEEARSAFAKELSEAVSRLAVKHHDAEAPESARFRVVVGAHPSPGHRGELDAEGGTPRE